MDTNGSCAKALYRFAIAAVWTVLLATGLFFSNIAEPFHSYAAVSAQSGDIASPIYLAYFYQPGCDLCAKADRDVEYIASRYPQVKVRGFNIREEAALNQYLCLRPGWATASSCFRRQ